MAFYPSLEKDEALDFWQENQLVQEYIPYKRDK